MVFLDTKFKVGMKVWTKVKSDLFGDYAAFGRVQAVTKSSVIVTWDFKIGQPHEMELYFREIEMSETFELTVKK